MPTASGTDTQIQTLIDQALAGNPDAHAFLIEHAGDRLLRLTRKMFHGFPDLRRWEQTDDVFQNALIRLHRALSNTQIESVRHFFNLATVQIRRELLDLTKHHFGPHGDGANHHTDHVPNDDTGGTIPNLADRPTDPKGWFLFHEAIEKLSPEDQEIISLLFYEGLSHEDAGKVLGVSARTLKRRWAAVKLKMHEVLNDGQGQRQR